MEVAMSAPEEAKSERRSPEIVLRDGRPAAVILDIDEYQDMLERLEDLDDLEMLKSMREKPLEFRKLEEFLAEYRPSV
jgi:PHD/YefM family antitoxin component YafN of YafNO toxin-antitoxin module